MRESSTASQDVADAGEVKSGAGSGRAADNQARADNDIMIHVMPLVNESRPAESVSKAVEMLDLKFVSVKSHRISK